jgi:exopolysaccharide biosynthesis protein
MVITRAEANVVSALVALIALACGARTPRLHPPQPDSAYSAPLIKGVTHEFRWYAAGPWAVHTLTIDPKACGVALRTVKAMEHVTGRERTTSMARRSHALAAINADFFSLSDPPGVSEGPQISRGVLLKSEGAHREALEDRRLHLQPVFAIKRNGKPAVTFTRLDGSVRIAGHEVPLAGLNARPRKDSAFVFTSFWGDATPTDSAALEVVVRNGAVVQVDSLAAGVAIPQDGIVVMFKGAARTGLPPISSGSAVTWNARLAGLAGAREVVGGYPMLLQQSHAVHHDEAGLRATFSDQRHPRAAIGVDHKGLIHIVAVDGRQPPYSVGMTLQELGDFMRAHGITDALNLDGGGSTTLVLGERIVNRPSDANGERAVSNALLLFDQTQARACHGKR